MSSLESVGRSALGPQIVEMLEHGGIRRFGCHIRHGTDRELADNLNGALGSLKVSL